MRDALLDIGENGAYCTAGYCTRSTELLDTVQYVCTSALVYCIMSVHCSPGTSSIIKVTGSRISTARIR
jgi:hypothetical protein